MPRPPDPRRTPRRGTTQSDDSTVVPLRGRGAGAAQRGGLADARRYTPRARTVREAAADAPGELPTALPKKSAQAASGRAASSKAASGRAASSKAASSKVGSGRAVPRTAATKPSTGRTTGAGRTRGAVARAHPGPVRKPRVASRRPVRSGRPVDPRRRLRLGTVLALAVFTLIAGRLVQIQLTDAKAYAAEGLKDRLRTIDLPASRGAIYDRDGAILVRSVEARSVVADPTLVKDPEATADRLFPDLSGAGITRSELVVKLSPHKRSNGQPASFEYLVRGVDISLGTKVIALELPGVWVERDERREVPGHDLAANVVGFTRSADRAGLAGIEAAYDSELRGRDGKRTYERGESNLNQAIPGGYSAETPARPGKSLRLTIDRDLQYDVQLTLTNRMREVQGIFGAALVLDVHTGEVLAQASYPTYDAADPYSSPAQQQLDACTQIVFDPGSVHKSIVIGAALEEGVITPDSTVAVDPSITKGDQRYPDTHPQPKGTLMTIPGILAYSSNVGTIKIADLLGRQKLYEYQQRFGLGQRTGEGLPSEAPGQLLPPEQWTGSSPGSIPIGDGVAVTALQMAAAYAAIANDGVWVQPHLVRSTIAPDGKAGPITKAATRQVLSAEHARQLRTMLEGVTTLDGATGKLAAIPGYRIAGKTGTGLMPQNGGYAPGNVASFIGMAPADNPRYVVAVFAHVPSGVGGSVSAPAFRDMMAFTLGHFQVPPTNSPAPTLKIFP